MYDDNATKKYTFLNNISFTIHLVPILFAKTKLIIDGLAEWKRWTSQK